MSRHLQKRWKRKFSNSSDVINLFIVLALKWILKTTRYVTIGKQGFIVIQPIKNLPIEKRKWALDRTGFKRLSDGKTMDIINLSDEDKNSLFYKEESDMARKRNQRLIITYSPKYAAYQKNILKEERNIQEKQYDGLYTDLLDGSMRDILQAGENRWQKGRG